MKRIFISAILLTVIAAGANAQSKALKVYKNGHVFYQESVSSVDSVIFVDLPTTVEVLPWEPEMVTVQGGTTDLNDTTVTISSFTIGKYEITQKTWEYVMGYSGPTDDGGTLPPITIYRGSSPDSTFGKGDNYPVYYVSYEDIVNTFIPRLNLITGKIYRLPTEAEWEYAAKGGQQTHDYTYSGSNAIGNVAWYWGNSSIEGTSAYGTRIVGIKDPNELGIYDMSGNVREWCSDWYASMYPSGETDPTGASSGSRRVARGGSWSYYANECTVSFRYSYTPSSRSNFLGFRLVLVP